MSFPLLSIDTVKGMLTSPEKIQCLYTLMNRFHNAAKEFNVTYWAVGGTLLGAIREGRIIMWDDDLDVTVLYEEIGRVRNMLDAICKEEGYTYNTFKLDNTIIWQLFYTVGEHINLLDIFISTRHKDGVLSAEPYIYNICTDINNNVTFPNDLFIERELFTSTGELVEKQFGDIMINIPLEPEIYLDRKYPKWREVVHIWNHTSSGENRVYAYNSQILDDIFDKCCRDNSGSL